MAMMLDRFSVRRLATAIAGQAGYRVLRTYTAPASAGAYVIDLQDTITKLTYTVRSAEEWIDVRGRSTHERRVMAAKDEFPEQDLEGARPAQEGATMQTAQAAPTPAPALKGFNFAQWKTITRGAIEQAEAEVTRLQTERDGLDQLVVEAQKRARARRVEIDGQVAELRGTVKRLRRAIDVVDRPGRAQHAAGTVARAGRPALARGLLRTEASKWAQAHGGTVRVKDLGGAMAAAGYFPDRRTAIKRVSTGLVALTRSGVFVREEQGLYRQVVQP